jgi:proline iminopeptidase
VEEAGQGDTDLLVLPGGPGNSHKGYEPFLHCLPEHGIRVHVLNMVDCGFSDRTQDSTRWTLANYIHDIEVVRKQLGLTRFYLLGHSFGGLIALEYAKQHSSALKGIIISNMTDSWTGLLQNAGNFIDSLSTHDAVSQQLIQQMRSFDSTSIMFRRLADRRDSLTGPLYNQAVQLAKSDVVPSLQPFYYPSSDQNLNVFRHFWQSQEINEWDFRSNLAEMRIPVLLMGGGRDYALTVNDMNRMKANLPEATLAFCPQGGHLPFWTETACYYEPLLTFLKARK